MENNNIEILITTFNNIGLNGNETNTKKEYQKQYREDNKNKYLDYQRNYRMQNKEKLTEYKKNLSKEKIRLYNSRYIEKKKKLKSTEIQENSTN